MQLRAAGKITDSVWDGLWKEWQDCRNRLHQTLESLDRGGAFHIDNLDAALQMITKIGTLYNGLQQQDQKELLRQMVERVVVNHEGNMLLELRSPFAYLKDLTDEVRGSRGKRRRKTKTRGEDAPTGSRSIENLSGGPEGLRLVS